MPVLGLLGFPQPVRLSSPPSCGYLVLGLLGCCTRPLRPLLTSWMAQQSCVIPTMFIRLTTPFEKMMDAWCQQYDIPIEEAQFELHGRILQPSDSPSSCGWSAAKGVLEIRAQPKPDTHNIDDPDVSRMPASEQASLKVEERSNRIDMYSFMFQTRTGSASAYFRVHSFVASSRSRHVGCSLRCVYAVIRGSQWHLGPNDCRGATCSAGVFSFRGAHRQA